MLYTVLQLTFFTSCYLEVLLDLHTDLHLFFFFFLNSGIAFHPKDASCFIYPSSTVGHLVYFQFGNHP